MDLTQFTVSACVREFKTLRNLLMRGQFLKGSDPLPPPILTTVWPSVGSGKVPFPASSDRDAE